MNRKTIKGLKILSLSIIIIIPIILMGLTFYTAIKITSDNPQLAESPSDIFLNYDNASSTFNMDIPLKLQNTGLVPINYLTLKMTISNGTEQAIFSDGIANIAPGETFEGNLRFSQHFPLNATYAIFILYFITTITSIEIRIDLSIFISVIYFSINLNGGLI